MLKQIYIFAILCLMVLFHAASATSLADEFTPGTPYYFDSFDPGQQPWVPGQYLNIEEVYKNYQYYEIVFDQDGKGITVNLFLRGSKESSERYLVLPNRSLQKMTHPDSLDGFGH